MRMMVIVLHAWPEMRQRGMEWGTRVPDTTFPMIHHSRSQRSRSRPAAGCCRAMAQLVSQQAIANWEHASRSGPCDASSVQRDAFGESVGEQGSKASGKRLLAKRPSIFQSLLPSHRLFLLFILRFIMRFDSIPIFPC